MNQVEPAAKKLQWTAPKLVKLGNIREVVQAGQAFGKTGAGNDGESPETMTMN